MVEITLPPDGLAFTVAYLKAQYTAHGETTLVGTKIRDPRPSKFTKLRMMGGYDPDVARYAPMIVFECWAAEDLTAWNLGRLTYGLIKAMPDIDSRCSRTVHVGGLVDQPDPDSNTPRWVFTRQLFLRVELLA